MVCAQCKDRPATCVGRYEDAAVDEPACDTCCGHGNEDGHCEPIDKPCEECDGQGFIEDGGCGGGCDYCSPFPKCGHCNGTGNAVRP